MQLLIILAVVFLLVRYARRAIGGGAANFSGSPLPLGLDTGNAPGYTATAVDAGSDPANYGLTSIVQAVQHFESGGRQFDANGQVITSKAGALGIMQLMPSTAAALGVDPRDEAQNIQGGTTYLQQLYAKYGNWYDALAAYVWGPGKVDNSLASGAPFPTSVHEYATGVIGYSGVDDNGLPQGA